LLAWHEHQIAGHLEYLAGVRDQEDNAGERLKAVLEAYALISRTSHGHNDVELVTFLHRDEQVTRAQQQVRKMVRGVVTDAQKTGDVRDDVAPDELASFCLYALSAARALPSKAAVRRLVKVILAGMRAPAPEQ
ncbi:MAG: TetR/AcrR family transcriptional regulator, partial [Chloroflexi bacterium]|nr:TetR/AcrR family transcriptional regulator [Chloroflexota bacterium]